MPAADFSPQQTLKEFLLLLVDEMEDLILRMPENSRGPYLESVRRIRAEFASREVPA